MGVPERCSYFSYDNNIIPKQNYNFDIPFCDSKNKRIWSWYDYRFRYLEDDQIFCNCLTSWPDAGVLISHNVGTLGAMSSVLRKLGTVYSDKESFGEERIDRSSRQGRS